MNKRIKHKHLKSNNLKRQESILNQLSQQLTIINKSFGNGYFVFDMGVNSVCHFQIKETPQWQYGIWLNKNKFQIFGEHVELVDKFKPSRTYLSFDNNLIGFIEKVKDISNNPELYFVDSMNDGYALIPFEKHVDEDGYIYCNGYQAVREYNGKNDVDDKLRRDETITQENYVNKQSKKFYDRKEQELKDEDSDRIYAFNFFKKLPNLINEIVVIGIQDNNRNGWRSSPRYDIKVVVDKGTNQERFDKIFEEVNDIIWNKDISEDKKTYEHGFTLKGCYDDLKVIKKCHYKYYKNK